MKKLNGTVIVTYRCNARCTMCSRYRQPSKPEEELTLDTIRKLPRMYFTNITGGEPFLREDLKAIVRELRKKSDRIVIYTNGYFTDRILDLCREFPDVGIRISIEGLEETNNAIRGLDDGYNRGLSTLRKLKEMGMKDIGFGVTVQDKNAPDLIPLYRLAEELDLEFATASLHNSFYFVQTENIIHDRPRVAEHFEKLVNELLKSRTPKKVVPGLFQPWPDPLHLRRQAAAALPYGQRYLLHRPLWRCDALQRHERKIGFRQSERTNLGRIVEQCQSRKRPTAGMPL